MLAAAFSRVKILQRVGFFAGADQLDRLAGDRAHRQRRAAAAVAVHTSEHDAGEADALVEGSREVDRVLASERIRDQQHFMRIGRCFDFGGFRHHLFVERGAAGGVEQHHVVAAEFSGFQRAARDLRRLLAGNDRQGLDLEIAPEHCELLHRRRAIDIEGSHQHLALVALGQAAGKFCSRGGFAGALQPDHHDRDRRHGVEVDGLAIGAQRRDQLVMNDLHHHLAGGDRLDHGSANRLLADFLGKTSDHVERDVGLEQRAPHLAHRRIDVGLRQRPAPRQPIENATKLFRQIVEHFRCPLPVAGAALIHSRHTPRKRGIQYAAASRVNRAALKHWITRFSRVMTTYCVSAQSQDTNPNTFAPEGASRCRALASGHKDRAAGRKDESFR